MHVFSLEGQYFIYWCTYGINEISYAMKHELYFAFIFLTSLIVTTFIAHSQMDVEEPNHNVEQEQCKFAL